MWESVWGFGTAVVGAILHPRLGLTTLERGGEWGPNSGFTSCVFIQNQGIYIYSDFMVLIELYFLYFNFKKSLLNGFFGSIFNESKRKFGRQKL